MSQAKDGDTVKIHYTGTLADKTTFDSSRNRDPLEFKIGGGNIIPGFEKAVLGMEEGESKTVVIPPEDAYGQRQDEMVMNITRDQLPPDLNPEVGQQLQSQQENGQIAVFLVTAVDEKSITVDANHPLAGKELTFEIELMEIAAE